MKKHLFKPGRIRLPQQLILTPYFWARDDLDRIKIKALKVKSFLLSEVIVFPDYAVITGFMGYPHILTLLEFIEDIRDKRIFFLGSAGSLNPKLSRPTLLQVEEIHASSLVSYFSKKKSLAMETISDDSLPLVRGVSVDLIQRETKSWLKKQLSAGIDIVEMEIFPLRTFLAKSFLSLVVISDLLSETGIQVFTQKERFLSEFKRGFQLIVNLTNQ